MNLTYRLWDKQSPINSCPADKAMESLRIQPNDEVYIIVNENGADWIVQTKKDAPYPGATIEKSAQNHIAAINAEREQKPEDADLAAKVAAQEEALKIIMGGTENV